MLSRRYEGKFAFQTIAIELYKQPKMKQQKKRTHKISNSLYWGRCDCQNRWWDLYLKYYQNL